MPTTVLINGEASARVSVKDRGLNYGDGLYETILVVRGLPVFLEPHLSRLHKGCQRLCLTPLDVATLKDEIYQLASGLDRGVVKLILTRGESERGLAVNPSSCPTRIVQSFELVRTDRSKQGAHLRLCNTRLSYQPLLAGLKHLNQIERVLARMEWSDASIHEGLMCGPDGAAIEGTMSNLFIVRAGAVLTPELSQCGVEGVIREQILAHSRDFNASVDVAQISVEDVRHADELFITNSLLPVWPVTRFENTSYPIGPVTLRVMEWMSVHIEQDLQSQEP